MIRISPVSGRRIGQLLSIFGLEAHHMPNVHHLLMIPLPTLLVVHLIQSIHLIDSLAKNVSRF